MYRAFDANLGNIIVVKECIGDGRACEKKQARRNEEKGAQVKPLGGFGGCCMNWYEGFVLDDLGFRIEQGEREKSRLTNNALPFQICFFAGSPIELDVYPQDYKGPCNGCADNFDLEFWSLHKLQPSSICGSGRAEQDSATYRQFHPIDALPHYAFHLPCLTYHKQTSPITYVIMAQIHLLADPPRTMLQNSA